MKMKEKMFKSLILTCILVLVTSCKEQKSQTAGSDYKTQKVTLSDRTVYSTFSATIQGKQDVGVYPQISPSFSPSSRSIPASLLFFNEDDSGLGEFSLL